ncbi:MAG: hypothetical protein GTO63_30005 [Anaerolineae bacterium]|nr:hypothetical protein [Anaerolineae bacterium]NIQ81839.1 hypothetical protein [Anaerolineae bacterium]
MTGNFIKVTQGIHPYENRATGWYGWFRQKPTLDEMRAAWDVIYPTGATDDIGGDPENHVDTDIEQPSLWKVWLGCYQ